MENETVERPVNDWAYKLAHEIASVGREVSTEWIASRIRFEVRNSQEKKPRLFFRCDEVTNGILCHCGGPELKDAIDGLRNHLHAEKKTEVLTGDLDLQVIEMTDDEVAALPDC